MAQARARDGVVTERAWEVWERWCGQEVQETKGTEGGDREREGENKGEGAECKIGRYCSKDITKRVHVWYSLVVHTVCKPSPITVGDKYTLFCKPLWCLCKKPYKLIICMV